MPSSFEAYFGSPAASIKGLRLSLANVPSPTFTSFSAVGYPVLAASSSYPVITLTVNVASNAPSSVTNTAAVSGGGELNTTNNSANDPTTTKALADLSIEKMADTMAPAIGGTVVFTLWVTNHGPSDATGVEVLDHLPSG
jgi:uncharacterized repeat protein (TIGR01451 family)